MIKKIINIRISIMYIYQYKGIIWGKILCNKASLNWQFNIIKLINSINFIDNVKLSHSLRG